MAQLDNYRSALLAAFPDVADAELAAALEKGGLDFVSFVIDHGLGPLWHVRTGRAEFHASRMSAEALYLAQEQALIEIGTVLDGAGIEYAVIKGAASRELLHENPAIRACQDLDLLVRPEDRVRTAAALVDEGFTATPVARSISRELVLSKGVVDVDLHWELLREGRLRSNCAAGMLSRRRRCGAFWMLSAEDAFFVLIVHPAFAKHLAGWGMGLHRVADIVAWLRTQSFDWQAVRARLEQNGVQTAAWATLRWVQMLTRPHTLPGLDAMRSEIRPGRLRKAWVDRWLRHDLSERTSNAHWARLLGFSLFLHDTPADAVRALTGRYRAHRRSSTDLEAFQELPG
ncbi:MAG: nucleotidyltransferase family protein [Proteobacteria bacterium]|nr:nucleotidyltransferase family protein [Pseudomonadota bacterium]